LITGIAGCCARAASGHAAAGGRLGRQCRSGVGRRDHSDLSPNQFGRQGRQSIQLIVGPTILDDPPNRAGSRTAGLLAVQMSYLPTLNWAMVIASETPRPIPQTTQARRLAKATRTPWPILTVVVIMAED
jgi:hypothetical protein